MEKEEIKTKKQELLERAETRLEEVKKSLQNLSSAYGIQKLEEAINIIDEVQSELLD